MASPLLRRSKRAGFLNHSISGRVHRTALSVHGWVAQLADPLRLFRGLRGLGWYWADLRAYRQLPQAEPIRWSDLTPALHERSPAHELDAHYFYLNAWAARRILVDPPPFHVDLGSQVVLAGIISAGVPITYLDYRPLRVTLPNLTSVGGDLLRLPFRDSSVPSLSCLHVAEHVGLGRYGDALDPAGTRKAVAELERVVSGGGDLYLAVPVGRPRVCFNAHRVHDVESILEMFRESDLIELSAVDDEGCYREHLAVGDLRDCNYACGMFRLKKRTW